MCFQKYHAMTHCLQHNLLILLKYIFNEVMFNIQWWNTLKIDKCVQNSQMDFYKNCTISPSGSVGFEFLKKHRILWPPRYFLYLTDTRYFQLYSPVFSIGALIGECSVGDAVSEFWDGYAHRDIACTWRPFMYLFNSNELFLHTAVCELFLI